MSWPASHTTAAQGPLRRSCLKPRDRATAHRRITKLMADAGIRDPGPAGLPKAVAVPSHDNRYPVLKEPPPSGEAGKLRSSADAASHDQFAAIRRLQPRHHIRKRRALMLATDRTVCAEPAASPDPVLQGSASRPVAPRVPRSAAPCRQISVARSSSWRSPPLVAGSDDRAHRKRLACRCGNERIRMRLRNLRT